MKKLIVILLVVFFYSFINIKSQDCNISFISDDTINAPSTSIFIDISFDNTSACFDKMSKINKYAYERLANQDYLYIKDVPIQVEVFDLSGKIIEPIDGRLHNNFKSFYDKYIIDTTKNICSYKVGIVTGAYRLNPYELYKAKLLIIIDNHDIPFILSTYTFYIRELPSLNKKKCFLRLRQKRVIE